LIEVKPFTQLEDSINIAKWYAAYDYCVERNWRFRVWTEVFLYDDVEDEESFVLTHLNRFDRNGKPINL
jgi:hypothetical protein